MQKVLSVAVGKTLLNYVLTKGSQRNERLTFNLGSAECHKVLGKVMKYTVLMTTELDKLTLDAHVPNVDISKRFVYNRVLISGMVYTSDIYTPLQ